MSWATIPAASACLTKKMKMNRLGRFLVLLALLGCMVLPAACGETVSCTLEEDRFIGPSEAKVYVETNGVNIYAVRGEDGKALPMDRKTGICTAYVSQEALERGSIILNITLGRSDGETFVFELPIRKVSDECSAELYVLFPDRAVYEGEVLPVRYEIVNRGDTDLIDVILNAEDGTGKRVDKLLPGESAYLTLYRTMERDGEYGVSAVMHSAFTGREETRILTGVSPVFAEENIVLGAVYDTSVRVGQSARVTLSIENKGNCSFSGCKVTCGGRFMMSDVPYLISPGDFITLSLTTPILTESGSVKFELAGVCGNGEKRVFTTKELPISVLPSGDGADTQNTAGEDHDSDDMKRDIVMGIVRMGVLPKVLIVASLAVCAVLLIALTAGYQKKHEKKDK